MKALLLTSIPPCCESPAGIVLHELVRLLPRDSIISVAVIQPAYADAVLAPDLDIPHLRLITPNERGLAPRPRLGWLTSRYSRWREKHRSRVLKRLIAETANFGRAHQVDRIWAHLEATWTIRMSYPLARILNLPLYTMVFDPPGWYMNANLIDPWTQAELNQAFGQAIQTSESCATVSVPMAEEYASRFGVRTQPLWPAFDSKIALSPLLSLRESDTFRIGVAGQIYAQDAWWHLLDMLDALNWNLEGRRVIIRYLGRNFEMGSDRPRNVEYLGWHSQTEALELLGECDLLYCPYPFDAGLEEVSRLSFPSKVPLYLAAARPIFFHGPEYASPSRIFKRTNSALLCHRLDKFAMYNELKRLFSEPTLYGNLCFHAAQALREHFSLEVMRRNLYTFLNIAETDGTV
jgi:hypothetical protein